MRSSILSRWSRAMCLTMTMFGALLVTSCDQRHLLGVDEQDENRVLALDMDVDWSEFDEKPTGMTVMLYPVEGDGKPLRFLTNNVDHINVRVPLMEYEMLVFNQSVDEFSSVNFRGMDHYNTAEVFLPETDDNSNLSRLRTRGGTKALSSSVKIKPQTVGSSTQRVGDRAFSKALSSSVKIKPTPNVGGMSICIYCQGLNNVFDVTAKVSGMAKGFMLGEQQVADQSITQILSDWKIQSDGNGNGSISTTFGTFGISSQVGDSRSGAARRMMRAEGDEVTLDPFADDQNILTLSFLLNDGSSVDFSYDITDRIDDKNAGQHPDPEDPDTPETQTPELDVVIGVNPSGKPEGPDEDENGVPNIPIPIPSHGTQGGFNVGVDDWGDENVVNVIVH